MATKTNHFNFPAKWGVTTFFLFYIVSIPIVALLELYPLDYLSRQSYPINLDGAFEEIIKFSIAFCVYKVPKRTRMIMHDCVIMSAIYFALSECIFEIYRDGLSDGEYFSRIVNFLILSALQSSFSILTCKNFSRGKTDLRHSWYFVLLSAVLHATWNTSIDMGALVPNTYLIRIALLCIICITYFGRSLIYRYIFASLLLICLIASIYVENPNLLLIGLFLCIITNTSVRQKEINL